jgi:large subunit ribosomal protein L21
MFAIVEISGKQYKVSPGDKIDVDRLVGDIGSIVTFEKVLLTDTDGKVKVGTPKVDKLVAKAKILENIQDEKINVRRYKHKVRYRKSMGFRAKLTKLEILSIE